MHNCLCHTLSFWHLHTLAKKNQPSSTAHFTDSKVCNFYLSKAMFQCLQPILQKLIFQVSDDPTPICEEIQPTIDIIKAKHITIRVEYISVPIHNVH